MGQDSQDNGDVTRDASGTDGASAAPEAAGAPRPAEPATPQAGPESHPEPEDAPPWYVAPAAPDTAEAVASPGSQPPIPPLPPVPPFTPSEAEPADAAEEPVDDEPHDAPPSTGTLHMGRQEPRDAVPGGPGTLHMGRAEPEDVSAGEDGDGPGTVRLGAVEPRDAVPGGPGTLHMGRAEPEDVSAGEDGDGPGTVRLGAVEPRDAVPGGPGTLHMGRREPEDAPPAGSPWAGAPADEDEVDASLGGDAPLVGAHSATPVTGVADADEDDSLGGDAPLVGLPTASPAAPGDVASLPTEPAGGSDSGSDSGGSGGVVSGASEWWPDQAGRLVAGRYRLLDAVGRGGMGTVWRADDEMLGRTVAVKELRMPGGVDDGERSRLITRTLREAKAIASIRSRGVVTIFDVVDEGSRPWIVMELIEGRSLADIIRADGPMPPRRVAEIGLAVLDVLRAAHLTGVLHRDVKPSNVLVAQEDGRVVLTDFGIAKVEGDPSITSTGMLVGAPSYISPERARGETLGPPADLWSLGALLYCCVEGWPPYDEGSAIATLAAVMHEPVPRPRQAGEMTEVITGLLDKDPDRRLDEPRARELLLAVLERNEAPADAAGALASGEAADSTMVMGARSAEETPTSADASASSASPASPISSDSPASTSPGTFGPPLPAVPPDGPLGQRDEPDPLPVPPPGPPVPRSSPSTDTPTTVLGGGGGVGGDPAGPAGPAGPPDAARRRRRVLVIAGVAIVVLAIIGAALAATLGGDSGGDDPQREGDSQGQDAGGGSGGDGDPANSGGSGGTDPSPSPGESGRPSDDPSGDPSDDPSDDGPPGTSPGRDPDATIPENPTGFAERVEEDLRFGMALPESWERTGGADGSDGSFSAPGGGPPSVRVDFNSSPGDSALSALRSLEPAVAGDSSDYEFVSIAPVAWRDYATVADWEYERTEGGQRVHVLNRGFRVDDDQGYVITITCAAAEWEGQECRTLRETAFATFRPLN